MKKEIKNKKNNCKPTTLVDLIELKKLNWQELHNLNKNKTVCFLPISPLEEHGPHLPVGTDLLTAEDATKQAMQKIQQKDKNITCVLLPSLPIGYCDFNTDFPGSFSVNSKTIKEIVLSFGSSLALHGFQYLVICTYHMALGHLKGIYQAKHILQKKYQMKVCEPWAPVFYSHKIDEAEPKLGFETEQELHAGFRETSLIKYQYPYLLDSSYTTLPPVYKKLDSPKDAFKKFKQLGIQKGYIGNPAKADATYGRWFFHFTVDTIVTATFSLLDDEPTLDLPKEIKKKMKLLFWQ